MVVVCSMSPEATLAADQRWDKEAYPYTIIDQDVRHAAAELGRNLGVGVDLSDEVEGRLRGPWTSATVGDFLDRVAADLDAEWFFDGRRFQVSSASETVSRVLPLGGIEAEAWQSSLEKLGLRNERFPITIDPDQNVALVSGPPKYVSLIIEALPKPKPVVVRPAEPVGRVNVIYGRTVRGGAS